MALISASFLGGQTVPGRYLVELNSEPVAVRVVRARAAQGLHGAAARSLRAKVQAEQDTVQARIEALQSTVIDRVDTVSNALIVDSADAAQLAAIPGVKKVHPVRLFPRLMDRAVVLNKVVDAWNQIGGSANAGAGIKVAIVDTGVDASHAAFQDSTMVAPDGFPKVSASGDTTYTNGKVIVARSYVSLLSYQDIDYSARDHMGHGTALAAIVGGVSASGPLATITGVAPRAWIGNYKVFGTPGYNDYASDAAILKALDDAVKDGMDVINISLGSTLLAYRLADDPDVQAVENAVAAGVIVVVAAGNDGTDPNTIASPATALSAITAGATTNDRTFAATAEAVGVLTAVAIPGSGPVPSGEVTGLAVDVTRFDGNGLGCSGYTSGALAGKIALIQRGTCTFEDKINYAAAAGAVGVLVYTTDAAPDPFIMSVGTATLPAEMINHTSGVAIAAAAAAADVTLTLRFTLGPAPIPANRITDFSGAGPNVDNSIKPDVMAVGGSIYVATQSYDSNGDMYDASGYVLVNGTSFSSPLTAGAVALLKAARPGLSVAQYKSLVVNSGGTVATGDGSPAPIQRIGGGLLDVNAALQLTATAVPASLSFGTTRGTLSQTVTLTNVGSVKETYTLSTQPLHGAVGPAVDGMQVQLDPGAAASIPVAWDTSGLSSGTFDGYVVVTAASTGIVSRLPYWFASSSATPTHITMLQAVTDTYPRALQRERFYVRVTDEAGLVIPVPDMTAKTVSGGGSVRALYSYDTDVPGVVGVDVQLGRVAGTNVFRLQCGSATLDVSIISY